MAAVPDEPAVSELGGPLGVETFMTYATAFVTTFATNLAQYIAQIELLESIYYELFPDIIKEICKFYRYYFTIIVCQDKGGFLEIPKLLCHLNGYGQYLEKLQEIGKAWILNSYGEIEGYVNEIYNTFLDNNKQLFNMNTILYKPVSISYVMKERCNIINHKSTTGNNNFPFSKVGGICTVDGCDSATSNKYCSCNTGTQFNCPFEQYNNNLTKCQASILKIPTQPKSNDRLYHGNNGTVNCNVYCKNDKGWWPPPKGSICVSGKVNGIDDPKWCNQLVGYNKGLQGCNCKPKNIGNIPKVQSIDIMRKNILYWFNTMVGTNGCFQRALGMKYGKCLSFNGKSLDITLWDPSKNKIDINKNANTNLFRF